jgi:hypothetical protein
MSKYIKLITIFNHMSYVPFNLLLKSYTLLQT